MATKAKTNKGALKRFRANGAGTVIKRRRSGRGHNFTKTKTPGQKRRLRTQNGIVSASNIMKVFKLLKSKLISVIKRG